LKKSQKKKLKDKPVVDKTQVVPIASQKKKPKEQPVPVDKTKVQLFSGQNLPKSHDHPFIINGTNVVQRDETTVVGQRDEIKVVQRDEKDDDESIESTSEIMQNKLEELENLVKGMRDQVKVNTRVKSNAGRPKGASNQISRIAVILKSDLLRHDVAGLDDQNPLMNQASTAYRLTKMKDPMIVNVNIFLDCLIAEHGTNFPELTADQQVYMGHPYNTLCKLPKETIIFIITGLQRLTEHDNAKK
jgi:hypothetical protein